MNSTLTTDANRKMGFAMGDTMANLNNARTAFNKGEAISNREMDVIRQASMNDRKRLLDTTGSAIMASGDLAEALQPIATMGELQSGAMESGAKAQDKAAEATDNYNKMVNKAKADLAALSNQFLLALASSNVLPIMMQAFKVMANLVMNYVVPFFYMMVDVGNLLLGSILGMTDAGNTLKTVYTTLIDIISNVLSGAIFGVKVAFEGLMRGVDHLLVPLKNLWTRISDAIGGFGWIRNVLIEVGSFMGNVFELLGWAIGKVIDGFVWLYDHTVGLLLKIPGVSEALDTLKENLPKLWKSFKFAFSVEGVKYLYESVKTGFLNLVDDISNFFYFGFQELWHKILSAIPGWMGGFSDAQKEENRKRIDDERKQAEEIKKERIRKSELILQGYVDEFDAKEEKLKEDKKNALKLQRKLFDIGTMNLQPIGQATTLLGDNVNQLNNITKDQLGGTKNYGDAIALLKQEAAQQKSAFVPTQSQVVSAVTPDKAAAPAAGGGGTAVTSTSSTAVQTTSSSKDMLVELNSNMVRLVQLAAAEVDISRKIATNTARDKSNVHSY